MATTPGLGLPAMGQTEEEIKRAVISEIEAELAGKISPIEDLISRQQQGQAEALAAGEQLYGSIQPSVENATRNLQTNFDQSIGFEKGIFDASQARIAGIRAQAGAQAQQLAQQLGVPVPVSLFDMGAMTEQGLGLAEGAGSVLSHQGLRDAALAEAEAFSGRVFPLMRKEAAEATRRHYTKEITSLQKEIKTLRQMKPGLINERTRTRLLEERGYQLERAKAQRDWDTAKKGFGLENKKYQEAVTARKEANRLTKRAQDLQAKAAAAGEATTRRGQDISKQAADADRRAKLKQADASNKLYEAKRTDAIQANVMSVIQAALKGGSVKLKTVKKDALGSYTETTRDYSTGEGIVNNPNEILQLVRASVPGSREMPDFVRKTLIAAFHSTGSKLPQDWVEGQAAGKPTEKNIYAQAPTRATMEKWSLSKLDTWARRNMDFVGGYPGKIRKDESGSGKRKRKAWLMNWIAIKENEAKGPQTFGPR